MMSKQFLLNRSCIIILFQIRDTVMIFVILKFEKWFWKRPIDIYQNVFITEPLRKTKRRTFYKEKNYLRRRSIYTCNASKQYVKKMHHDVIYILFFDLYMKNNPMEKEWETYGKWKPWMITIRSKSKLMLLSTKRVAIWFKYSLVVRISTLVLYI